MLGLAFLIIFLILMTLFATVPQLLGRLFIPGVISIMLIGITLSPNTTNFMGFLSGLLGRGFPVEYVYVVIEVIGLLGMVFLMSLAGMEVDLAILKTEKKGVILLSIFTFSIPSVAGYFVYAYFRPDDTIGKLLYASLFASHSVGIVFPMIKDLRIVKTRFGITVLSATVITDLASLILLAVCVQLKRHGVEEPISNSISIFDRVRLGGFFIPIFLGVICAYVFLMITGVPRLSRLVFARLGPRDDVRLTFFLAIVLGVVFLGELIGVSIIVGAFIAGMSLARCTHIQEDGGILHQKLEGIGYGFLIPFMFFNIGLKTDPGVLFSPGGNGLIILFTVAGLVISKVGSGYLALLLAGFGHKKALCAGLMTVPQLSATLAAATIGLEFGIIDSGFFNAIVVLSIVTTIPIPSLVKILINRATIRFDDAGANGGKTGHAGGRDRG